MTWPSLSSAKLWCVFILFAVSALLFSAPAHGQNTIFLPGNYPTIQSAINASNNGDTIVAAPGTYVENINFNGKAIALEGSAGATATIIDGGANGTVVTFNHNETLSSTLDGFTIRSGYLDGGDGAGILIGPVATRTTLTRLHTPH
ncbi:MAG TPA: hypothetical protein VFN20_05645 [Candidatus Acidoferrum sp.]|nr:hypothetical protein [Candidatus Acidoferrum sp.]